MTISSFSIVTAVLVSASADVLYSLVTESAAALKTSRSCSGVSIPVACLLLPAVLVLVLGGDGATA